MNRRRAPLVVGLVVVLMAGLVADRLIGPAATVAAARPGSALPAQAPPGALSSTWFCPPTTAVPNGLADGRVVIANPTDNALTGVLTVVPSQGSPRDQTVRVDPRHRTVIRPGDVVAAPYDAVVVQLDGSAGVVEQQMRGGLGESSVACATHASDHWYFAWGATDPNALMLVSLFNPFPGDAVIDLDFATDTGRVTPGDLQGVVVPGRGVTVIDVGQHVRRRLVVSTNVSVRTGRVVADRIQLRGLPGPPPPAGTKAAAPSGPRGATLALGAPAPGTRWYFPDGVADTGVNERYEIYNPTDREADVEVALILDRGSADPFDVVVAPHDRTSLDVNTQSRIPRGVAHAGVVTATNGVPVVAERVITSGPPSTHLGISTLLGSPSAWPRWFFAAGAANAAQDEWLVVFNPGAATTHVSVTGLLTGDAVPIDGLQGVEVGPSQRVGLRLGDHLDRGDVMASVVAEAPVVVERDLYRVGGGPGMSAALGEPGP